MLAGWLAGAARAVRGLPAAPLADESPPPAPADQPPAETPEPIVQYPIIEAAAQDLRQRQIMTREQFDQLDADAKSGAFTAARVTSEEALQKLADAITTSVAEGGTLADFRAAVKGALGPDFLSAGHVETIFRTNVATAYSAGLMETLAHPLVADEFPYLAYYAVHDSRTRHDHLAMEHRGLDSTNVYRRDDPIWDRFTPPWSYNCRCVIVPLGVEDAAAAGVREAKEWLRSGEAPAAPEWVQTPPFGPPPGWRSA